MFTHESTFQLNANNLRAFKFRKRPPPTLTKYNPNYKIMVWGGICSRGKTSLHFVEGKVNARKYKEILLDKKIDMNRLFNKRGKWHFLQDNAPSHRTNHVKDWIKTTFSCELLPHPPQSPDLNPIELIWAMMKVQVEAKRPRNKSQLKDAIEKSWKSITIAQIKKCIYDLPSKMFKIIDCDGDLL